MDCLPLNDLCRLQEAQVIMRTEAAIAHRLDYDTMLIGTFNNRNYYHTWLNGQSVIVIENQDPEDYETPDVLPPP